MEKGGMVRYADSDMLTQTLERYYGINTLILNQKKRTKKV
jgi:hypothetical protein